MDYGKKVWIFPDAELPPEGVNCIPGHESVIVTNVCDKDADGLEEHAAPTSLIGLGDHVIVAADGGGRQEERVLTLYAQIIDRQIFLNSH